MSQPAIPADILRRVAEELAAMGARGTLAALSAVGCEAYAAAAPVLYAEVELGARGAGVLELSVEDVRGFPGFDDDKRAKGSGAEVEVDQVGANGEDVAAYAEADADTDPAEWWTHASAHVVRRLRCLSWVRRVVVRALSPDPTYAAFAAAAASASERGVRLLPGVHSVCLLPHAVGQWRTWTPDDYTRPRNPTLLEAVGAAASPRALCIRFRLVPSANWEEHRDRTQRGQYQFVRRLALFASSWTLESLTVHDVTHQILPDLQTRNVYHFAPHVVAHPWFAGRFRFPTRAEAARVPGPEWNQRPWQMSLAVKDHFPRGTDPTEAIQRTHWTFCGIQGGLLTKEARDDDDSTGVWYGEVEGMVKESLRVGLERDLAARGVDADTVAKVFDRIHYERPGVCEACECDPDYHPVMGVDDLEPGSPETRYGRLWGA